MDHKKIKRLRNKADRLLQEKNRRENARCMVCDKECTVGHHFWPKSTSSRLRYEMDNIVPLCQGCHLRHHSGDPTIHAKVLEERGKDWYKKLDSIRREVTKQSIKYFEDVIEKLK
jgi:5-methylcytosine-specific restriction endonuclease McrA|tara:strand:- start:2131 stop:2475 length:345 start_codon:yes stop_codon:yes gene_type:complete